MPKYEVTKLSYVGNSLVEPGTVVEYHGKPGSNLKPIVEAEPELAEPAPAIKPKKAKAVVDDLLE
jgi:hypothetical protein